MTLAAWQARLDAHFADLRRGRSAAVGDKPIFALEHGLDSEELQRLTGDVRAHVAGAPPSSDHALPWVVYAAEMGYGYSGDEYWQTFEAETPGWLEHGERDWLRNRFLWFHYRFGGARPTGRWANHFSIICWPITHAILPRDLQRQLARILYHVRHEFYADLLTSPEALGELIAARSWESTSRFQNLAQETLLIGQIAGALLLEGELGTAGLLLPATLKRIGSDLDRERNTREWLKSARRVAHERARFHGISIRRAVAPEAHAPVERAREQVAALGIEPRLVLRPTAMGGGSWDVFLEIPDLSHLLLKFPSTREPLSDSRCVVAGASGRPLARGRLLHGAQQLMLDRWPRQDEVLLQFERKNAQLDFLLRTECLLRPGPMWLFRVASDGLAYELRSLRVRPGQCYVVVSAAAPIRAAGVARTVALSCEGVFGALLDLPSALSPVDATWLSDLGLGQGKTIHVWPAGLAAARWDGEGRGEWLASEQPCIAICADHALESVRVTLQLSDTQLLELGAAPAGVVIFIELPSLPAGVHRIQVSAQGLGEPEDVVGELEMVIRAPRSWEPGLNLQGPFTADVEPPSPTLEELWEGRVEVNLRGPPGRLVTCTAKFFETRSELPSVSKRLPPLELPATQAAWRAHFEKHFRKARDVESAYDSARACVLEFRAAELGALDLTCEREFTPLRWAARGDAHRQTITLLDDSGASTAAEAGRFLFEAPDREERLDPVPLARPLEVPAPGGMYVARQGNFLAAVVVPPIVRGLADLGCNPRVASRLRTLEVASDTLERIGLWARARLTGNLLSATRQRQVLLALTRHLFFVLGGEVWERAELSAGSRQEGIQELKRAVSAKREEAGLAAALTLECSLLASASNEVRITRLVSLARSFLHLAPAAETSAPRDAGATLLRKQAVPNREDTPEWLCEFALRLASEPAGGLSWAGDNVASGLGRLFDKPVLARAARFFVLAIDRHVQEKHRDGGVLYAGWQW